jgi:hypothetical protein
MRFAAVLLSLALAWPGTAQTVTRGSWEQVAALPSDAEIELFTFEGKRIRGRFRAAAADGLKVEVKGKETDLRRNEVRVVKIKDGSRRLVGAALGGAIGAGIGLGLCAALLAGTGGSDAAGEIVATGTLIGGGIGFGLGLIPAGYRTMYQAKR